METSKELCVLLQSIYIWVIPVMSCIWPRGEKQLFKWNQVTNPPSYFFPFACSHSELRSEKSGRYLSIKHFSTPKEYLTWSNSRSLHFLEDTDFGQLLNIWQCTPTTTREPQHSPLSDRSPSIDFQSTINSHENLQDATRQWICWEQDQERFGLPQERAIHEMDCRFYFPCLSQALLC